MFAIYTFFLVISARFLTIIIIFGGRNYRFTTFFMQEISCLVQNIVCSQVPLHNFNYRV